MRSFSEDVGRSQKLRDNIINLDFSDFESAIQILIRVLMKDMKMNLVWQ